MSSWSFDLLEEYDSKITDIARGHGLDWFPIVYEICDYYEMIGHMSYHGMPSHYPHWSYGKSFERTHQTYNMGVEGLPYELIINSDPSIAYLMQENPAYLQLLIMCHCVGHSDFFKNNRLFKDTRPEFTCASFRSARKRIQSYIEDPSIGVEKIEEILDAAHSVRFQAHWYPRRRLTHDELKEEYTDRIKNDKNDEYIDFDIEKIPLEPDHDLLGFIIEHARNIPEWKRDVLNIVKEESQYFIPQIRTKIMNEGWASFWHYRLMHDLDLPQKYHIPFLKSHNQVIRPIIGGLNPYHLGFHLFKKIEERHGIERCFFAREVSHDESFLREYLTVEDCQELNLFSFSKKKDAFSIDDISDDDGWESVKNELYANIGMNTFPRIYVDCISEGNVLILKHDHDGRDLELSYADEVVQHVMTLWDDVVKLVTIVEGEPWEI